MRVANLTAGQILLGLARLLTSFFRQWEVVPGPQVHRNAVLRAGFWKDNLETGVEIGLEKKCCRWTLSPREPVKGQSEEAVRGPAGRWQQEQREVWAPSEVFFLPGGWQDPPNSSGRPAASYGNKGEDDLSLAFFYFCYFFFYLSFRRERLNLVLKQMGV